MNNENVGAVQYDARILTSQLRTDAKDVQHTVDSTAKQLDNRLSESESHVSTLLGGIMGKVKAAALGISAALGTAGVGVVGFGIKSAASFEQTRIGIENMLGSADKARALLGEISEFAAQTPFEFPELAQATRQLIAFGFGAEDAFKTMSQLGDVSAAVGAPINDLAYLMGTLRTQGRAFTVDIRQFAQRGIPIYEYLGKVLEKDEQAISSMIEEGKIGFPEVQKAFVAMTSEGGKFYKTMDKQSQSLSGQFSTLKDNLGQTVRELIGISKTGDVVEGSLFDKIREGIGKVNKSLPSMTTSFKESSAEITPILKQWASNTANVARQVSSYLGPKLSSLFNTIKSDFIPAVSSLAKAFGPAIGVGLVAVLGLTVDALNALFVVISPLLSFISENTWVVWGLVGAFAAVKAALAIQAAISAFQLGMTAIITAAASSGTALTVLTGTIGAARLALLGIVGPWQIVLAILGVAAVIKEIKDLSGWLDKLLNKWAKAGDVGITPDIKVNSNSDLGLTKRLMNAFGGFRASGGPVSAGKSYIVGERQPEVFVPHTNGTILPDTEIMNRSSGSNITVNVNMSGIMARSKSDERDIAKSLIRRVNEELGAKNMPLLGGGAI